MSFRAYTLTLALPGSGYATDGDGNTVPSAGSSLSVPCRLKASGDPNLRAQLGADAASVVLRGTWGSLEQPLRKPDGVRWGMTSPLEVAGVPGTLELRMAWPRPLEDLDDELGEVFIGLWKAAT